MGTHPHNAKEYDDKIEGIILQAMEHVGCLPIADETGRYLY